MNIENTAPNDNLSRLKVLVDKLTTDDSAKLDEIKKVAAEAAEDVVKKAAETAEEVIKKAAVIAADVIKDAAVIADELHKIIKH